MVRNSVATTSENHPLVPLARTTSNNDYLMPNSAPADGRRTEELDRVIPRVSARDAIRHWQKVNLSVRPFYKFPGDSPTHTFLSEVSLDDLIRLLYTTREGIDAPDRLVQIASAGAEAPLPIPIAELIAILDDPFIDWLNGEVEEHELRTVYGERLDELPVPIIVKKGYRCPLWIFLLPIGLLLIAGIFAFFAYRCSDGACLSSILRTSDAYPFRELLLTLPNASEYSLFAHPVGIEVVLSNRTAGINTTHIAVISANLTEHSTWVEDVALEKVSYNMYCPRGKRENCRVGGQAPLLHGHFHGDKSMDPERSIFLVEREEGETVVYRFATNGRDLTRMGSLTGWLRRHKWPIQDAIFDEKGTAVLLAGNESSMALCSVQADSVGRDYVGRACDQLGKVPCAAQPCDFSLLRISATRYAIAAHPHSIGAKSIVSFYSFASQSFLEKRIELVNHSVRSLFLLREHEPLLVCYVEMSVLVCRAYSMRHLDD